MYIFKKYKLQLVKESSIEYDLNGNITDPKDIELIARQVIELDKNAEEVLYIMALDVKNKVIGLMEVSRGTVDSVIASPRDICKRLLLTNAVRYIVLNNRVSGDIQPDKDDIQICNKLAKAGEIIGIELIDFCILGDGLYSFKEHGLV